MDLAAVIFDMDGLLLDSERLSLATFIETCDHFGLGEQTAIFMQCIGTNQALGEQVLKEGLQGKIDHVAFGRLWDSKYLEVTLGRAVPLKNGVIELLHDLKILGVSTAVATSTSISRATQKLNSSGILNHFDLVVGGDQVERSKPFPDIYLKAAELLRVRPERCLALEDSENGVRAALAAGMTVIQIPDLVEPSVALCALGHTVLKSLHDVQSWYASERSAHNALQPTG